MAKPANLSDAILSRASARSERASGNGAPDEGEHAKGKQRAPGRAGKVSIAGFFEPAVRKQLRQLALDTGSTNQDLVAEALNDLFAKHGLPEIAGG